MGTIKKSASKSKAVKKTSAKGGIVSKATALLSGKKSGGGGRRHRGPTYYANKLLVERLKKKLYKVKYGGK